jgi:hypothetical protein
MMLISTSFPRGHQRFTAAHELAHHLLRDPREIVIDSDLHDGSNPMEKRASAFAAALLMPAEGLRDVIAGRPIDETVLSELMRNFRHGYGARRKPATRTARSVSAHSPPWPTRTPSSYSSASPPTTCTRQRPPTTTCMTYDHPGTKTADRHLLDPQPALLCASQRKHPARDRRWCRTLRVVDGGRGGYVRRTRRGCPHASGT